VATKTKKRSPLKTKPLRSPGQSLDEEAQRLVDESGMPVLIAALAAVLLACYEWWRWFTSSPPQPWAVTIVAVGAAIYAAFHTVGVRRRLKNLRLGLEGERVVGQSLESLRALGFRVFHDIPGGGFNIDHVIVGPQGVFAIETKTFSKPVKGVSKVKYDGEKMLVNGREPDRNPVAQARANRDWVVEILQKATNRRFPTRGVVVLPGWWVDPPGGGSRPDTWVLNPKALPGFIRHEPVVLKDEDIALVSTALEYYVTRD
jgi:Nuclease-related domain